MLLTHYTLRKPVGFYIETRMDWVIEQGEVIQFMMPRFTRGTTTNGVTSDGSDVAWGDLRISPSMIFEASWTEGSLMDAGGPYSLSTLNLRLLAGVVLLSSYNIQITVYEDSGISMYCGFPSSKVVGKGVMSTDIPMFFATSSFNLIRGRSHADIINHRPFASYEGVGKGCESWGNCNNNGDCDYCYEKCTCRVGYGNDLLDKPYVGGGFDASCKTRMCPSGKAITDLATGTSSAHKIAECSNAGICDRAKGICNCFHPFEGAACDRLKCPNDCSGHGRCMLMSELALREDAQPAQRYVFEYGTAAAQTTTAWDSDVMSACLCDSAWSVGMKAGETQLSEYFGADCSLRHCPSGDDPYTHLDETHCWQLNQFRDEKFGLNMMHEPNLDDPNRGEFGNLCQIDCSNRGLCNYATGMCSCFDGVYGKNCGQRSRTGAQDSN